MNSMYDFIVHAIFSETKKSYMLVLGIATGSCDIETWQFNDDDYCKLFCEQLARNTGRKVYVIEGKVVGVYEVELPVKFSKTDIIESKI